LCDSHAKACSDSVGKQERRPGGDIVRKRIQATHLRAYARALLFLKLGMRPTRTAEIETAVGAYAVLLRAGGGWTGYAGLHARRKARRMLRLDCHDGFRLTEPLDSVLESIGVDPVSLRVVDHEKFQRWLD
jgi:hypothetical protein